MPLVKIFYHIWTGKIIDLPLLLVICRKKKHSDPWESNTRSIKPLELSAMTQGNIFDREALLKRIGGNEALCDELVSIFIQRVPAQIERLKEFLNQRMRNESKPKPTASKAWPSIYRPFVFPESRLKSKRKRRRGIYPGFRTWSGNWNRHSTNLQFMFEHHLRPGLDPFSAVFLDFFHRHMNRLAGHSRISCKKVRQRRLRIDRENEHL